MHTATGTLQSNWVGFPPFWSHLRAEHQTFCHMAMSMKEHEGGHEHLPLLEQASLLVGIQARQSHFLFPRIIYCDKLFPGTLVEMTLQVSSSTKANDSTISHTLYKATRIQFRSSPVFCHCWELPRLKGLLCRLGSTCAQQRCDHLSHSRAKVFEIHGTGADLWEKEILDCKSSEDTRNKPWCPRLSFPHKHLSRNCAH